MDPNLELTYIDLKKTEDSDINRLAEDYLIRQKWFCNEITKNLKPGNYE
jgi:hypothetical protein